MTDILDDPAVDNTDKRLADKDQHIGNLESELAELRAELRNRTSMEDLIAQMNAQPSVDPIVDPATNPSPNNKKIDETELSEKVRNILKAESENAKREANTAVSRSGLIERFGEKYNDTLGEIAKSLGVSEKFLSSLAATSPTGFFKVIDSVKLDTVNPQSNRPSAPPAPSVDTSKAFMSGNVRKNDQYYKDLYRKDKNLYFSAKVQQEMHEEAIRQGAKFYEP